MVTKAEILYFSIRKKPEVKTAEETYQDGVLMGVADPYLFLLKSKSGVILLKFPNRKSHPNYVSTR